MSHGYSTVAAYHQDAVSDDLVTGYAAPGGPTPALVRLTSDGVDIAYARASGYSQAAEQAGLRLGWCGFQLPGLRQAFALSDDVKICCGVTGEVLSVLSSNMVVTAPPKSVQLSSEDLVLMVRSFDCGESVEQLLPFALNHYRRRGARQFIEAAYQTVLGRWPDTAAPDVDFSLETDEERVEYYLLDLLESEECLGKWGEMVPGPFSAGFRFDREGLI